MERKFIQQPVSITKEVHDILLAEGKSFGLKITEYIRDILYSHVREKALTNPLLKSSYFNKNNVVKSQILLPQDYWDFLASQGHKSAYIFEAIKEKKERDFPGSKKKEGVKHGQKK